MKTTLKVLEPTEISETNPQNDKEEDVMMNETFTIDKHHMELIIGRSGTMMKSESLMMKYVIEKSDSEDRITDAEICGDKVKVVTIIGAESCIKKTKIEELIKSAKEKKGKRDNMKEDTQSQKRKMCDF